MPTHRLLSPSPLLAAAWMNLGIVLAAQNKTQVSHTLAHTLNVTFDLQEAETSYLTAIRHRNKYPDAYYNLGNLVGGVSSL